MHGILTSFLLYHEHSETLQYPNAGRIVGGKISLPVGTVGHSLSKLLERDTLRRQ